MDINAYDQLFRKVTWEEDLWFCEFLFQLEHNRGFYIKENFEKWENRVKRKLEQLYNTNWTIELLAEQISS